MVDDTVPPNAPPPGILIPDHQLIAPIGQGSYGEVWLAQNMMRTYRAIKIVHRRSFASARPFDREMAGLEKFEPISRSHEGFVDILQIGQNAARDYFFYIMELGDDHDTGDDIHPLAYKPKSLASELARRRRLPVAECINLGLGLSGALQCLHEHGLVHRDLKPSNIIFVSGTPKLADIGLVTTIEEAKTFVGTEGFIPPEGPGKPTADVYGLGKILFEAATGKDRTQFPALPDEFEQLPDAAALGELNEVILKACHPDATKRYQSAGELKGDLMMLVGGRSVKRLRTLERRFAKLKKFAAITLGICIPLGAFYTQQQHNKRRSDQVLQQQVGGLLVEGLAAVEEGDMLRAFSPLVAATHMDRKDPRVQETHRTRIESVFQHCPKLTQLWFADFPVYDAAFSPDGSQVAVAEREAGVRVWDPITGAPLTGRFTNFHRLNSIDYHPKLPWLLLAGRHHKATILEIPSFREVMTVQSTNRLMKAQFNHDGSMFASAAENGAIHIWSTNSPIPIRTLQVGTNRVLSVAFSHSGRYLVEGRAGGLAFVWDLQTGSLAGEPLFHNNWVYDVEWSHDDQEILTSCFDRQARVWDAQTRTIKFSMYHGDGISSGKYSPDGQFIVTAGLDRIACIWHSDNGRPASPFPVLPHTGRVMQALFDPSGQRVLAAGSDGTVRLWDLAGSEIVPSFEAAGIYSRDGRHLVRREASGSTLLATPTNSVSSSPLRHLPPSLHSFFSRNSRWFACVQPSPDTNGPPTFSLLRYDLKSPAEPPQQWTVPGDLPLDTLILANNGRWAAGFRRDKLHLLDFAQPSLAHAVTKMAHPIRHLFFADDAALLGIAHAGQVTVVDLPSQSPRFTTPESSMDINIGAFAPDGSWMIACPLDLSFIGASAYLWKTRPTGEQVHRLPHEDGILHAAFSFDGRKVVTATENFDALVWDVETGQPLTPPMKHRHQVRLANLVHDDQWLVTASSDGTAWMWDASSGQVICPPLPHPLNLTNAVLLPDANHLLTVNKTNLGQVWTLRPWEYPIEDWRELAALHNGYRVEEFGIRKKLTFHELQEMWRRMKERHPEIFQVPDAQVLAWHARMRDLCEQRDLSWGFQLHQAILAGQPRH